MVTKYDVYELKVSTGSILFSDAVTRSFGENRIVRTENGSFLSSVLPLDNDSEGLNKIGYIVNGDES